MVEATNEDVNLWLMEFAKNVQNDFPDAKIYLFGSRARDSYLLTSDVDLIVISKYFINIQFFSNV